MNHSPTPPAPGSPEAQETDFTQSFSEQEVLALETSTKAMLDKLMKSKSYTKTDYLMQQVKKELPKGLQENPKLDAMLGLIVKNLNMVQLGGPGFALLAPAQQVKAEHEMLALAEFETDEHILDKKIVEKTLLKRSSISEEQIEAVWAACGSRNETTVIEGVAGAGKSFTMQSVREAYADSGYSVMGVALSWTAAKVLEESAGIRGCVAIEGFLQEIQKKTKAGEQFFTRPTLLIVDEAGLVGTLKMRDILKACHESKAKVKVILTGDSSQLSPVDAGNSLEAIVNHCGSAKIDTIRRQKQDSHRRAVKFFKEGHTGKGLYVYKQQEALNWFNGQDELFKGVVRDYISYKLAHPDKKALILALSNKDVQTLNGMVRDAYKKMGRVEAKEYPLFMTDNRTSWMGGLAVGDRIVFRKNNKNKAVYVKDGQGNLVFKANGIFNRTSGTIRRIEQTNPREYDLTLELDNGCWAKVNTHEMQGDNGVAICHNFATTIYASQGQTVQKVFMLDSPLMNRRLAYVGMSRHTDNCQVYLNQLELLERARKKTGEAGAVYNKTELLQVMAMNWAKESQNQTAMMALKERQVGRKMQGLSLKEASAVRPDSGITNFVDFIPESNTHYPLIDLDSLMQGPGLPGPTPEGVPAIPDKEPGLLAKFLKPKPVRARLLPIKPAEQTPIKVKIEPSSKPLTQITGDEVKFMLGHPLLPGKEFLQKTKGSLWEIGKNQEMRLLGKKEGQVVSRYSVQGEDKLGFGYPVIVSNAQKTEETPIYLIKNCTDFMNTYEKLYQNRQDKSKIPHLVWCAAEARLEFLINGMKGKRVVVVRSKTDKKQITWAQELSHWLGSKGITCEISPALPTPVVRPPNGVG